MERARNTRRRRAILQVLEDSGRALTVQQIKLACEQTEHMDLSTVYRALSALCERGLAVKSVRADGRACYRLPPPHHSHTLRCERCKRTVSIDLCPVEELAARIGDDTGFVITGHRLELTGLCPDCIKQGGSK